MKHDVKIKYSVPSCEMGCDDDFTSNCLGCNLNCMFYESVDDGMCKYCVFDTDCFKIVQTTKLEYEDYGFNYDNERVICLKIGNTDYSNYLIKYLEVDGEILIKEEL